MSDTSRRTDALLRCLWSRKNESSFLGARTPFSLSLSLCFALLSSPLLSAMWRDVARRGATAVSISLFAGIVIKEGLGEFLSPRRAPPLRPSFSPPRTKHQADGLTRRSNLSLLPFSYPSRFSTSLFLGLVLLILRVLLPRFAIAAQPPNTPGSSFYTLCHFAPPLIRGCRSLPPPPSPPLLVTLFLSRFLYPLYFS